MDAGRITFPLHVHLIDIVCGISLEERVIGVLYCISSVQKSHCNIHSIVIQLLDSFALPERHMCEYEASMAELQAVAV